MIDLVGEYTVMCLYSKNWVLREAAVTRIEKLISSGQARSHPHFCIRSRGPPAFQSHNRFRPLQSDVSALAARARPSLHPQIQSDDDRETFRTLARGIQRLFKDKAR